MPEILLKLFLISDVEQGLWIGGMDMDLTAQMLKRVVEELRVHEALKGTADREEACEKGESEKNWTKIDTPTKPSWLGSATLLGPIPVGVSNRHVHLSREHVEILFGRDYRLRKIKDLTQPGQFACEETVMVVGRRGVIPKVRVLGPERSQTQVELSATDARLLGLKPPVRDSGDLAGSETCVLVGPAGYVVLKEGVIIAKRHIHMTPQEADSFGLKDKDIVAVYVPSPERAVVFDDVLVRVSDKYALDFHLDTDEANAAGVKTGDIAYIIKQ